MIKLSRRSSRIFGSLIDPEKAELLKKSKIEIAERVEKVFKEHEEKVDGSPEESKRVTELVELIEDFHKQYQSLYAVYDSLRGPSKNSSRIRKEKEGVPHPSSGSEDDEYYSPDEADLRYESEIAELKQAMASMNEEKESLNREYKQALDKIHEADEKEKDLGSEAAAQMKELEGQLTDLKVELETLHNKRTELESQVGTQATEVQEMKYDNLKLKTRVLELESQKRQDGDSSGNNENDLSSQHAELMSQYSNILAELISVQAQKDDLEKRMESIKNEASAQVKESLEQVNVMQQELESLHNQNHELELRIESIRNEASTQAKDSTEKVNVMQQKLESLRIQNQESEQQLESKSKEISEKLIQIETLKEELAKTAVGRRVEENKEDPVVKIRDLKQEAETLPNQRNGVEQQTKSKIPEIPETIKLRDEKEELQSSQRRRAREREPSASRKKSGSAEKQGSSQSLITQNIAKFNQILSERPPRSLKVSDDTAKVEPRTKLESARSLNSQNISMLTKFVKESDESMTKLTKLTPQGAERKMEELATGFRRSIDDEIRLLTRRIRVLEQLHAENRESYRLTRKTLEQENNLLLAKVGTYEAALAKMRDLYEASKITMKGLMFMVRKLEVGNTQLDRASKILNELQSAKNWFQGKARDFRQMERDLDTLNAQVRDKEKHILKLEAKVSQLEQKVEEKDGELCQLGQKVEDKDEELFCLGEEKREAIRQLSVLIDHHFRQNQELKEMILKLRGRIIQAAR